MINIADKTNTPDDMLVTRKDCAAYVGIGDRSWDRWERQGKCPKRCTPEGVSPRWRAGDVRNYFASKTQQEAPKTEQESEQTV